MLLALVRAAADNRARPCLLRPTAPAPARCCRFHLLQPPRPPVLPHAPLAAAAPPPPAVATFAPPQGPGLLLLAATAERRCARRRACLARPSLGRAVVLPSSSSCSGRAWGRSSPAPAYCAVVASQHALARPSLSLPSPAAMLCLAPLTPLRRPPAQSRAPPLPASRRHTPDAPRARQGRRRQPRQAVPAPADRPRSCPLLPIPPTATAATAGASPRAARRRRPASARRRHLRASPGPRSTAPGRNRRAPVRTQVCVPCEALCNGGRSLVD
nr:transcription initiation factor TFIID subunit 4-like [Aegilops tauschii subsp. strangulata]